MSTTPTPPESGAPILRARGLGPGVPAGDLEIPGTGLTLIHTERESHATRLALTLAGRMEARQGTVTLIDAPPTDRARRISRRVALAGVPEIDRLERPVPVRSVVREQLAWASPWYARVPGEIRRTRYADLADQIGLDVDPRWRVGELHPLDRLRLRCVLALIARPQAGILLLDDIDQLRNLGDRRTLLGDLRQLSRTLPVAVFSSNPDIDELADTELHLGRTPADGIKAED